MPAKYLNENPIGKPSMNHTAPQPVPSRRELTKRLFTVYKWLWVIPFLGVSTLVIGTTIICLAFLGLPDLASRVLGPIWAKINSLMMMLTVQVEGRDKFNPKQSYIIVANHQSQVDILALYGHLGVDFKWVMKQELRRVPVLGPACAAMGHIFIDRGNTESALTSINNARTQIKDGMSVVFFPEGTRSRDGELMHFKKGAYRLALELQLPILPVTILGTHHILPTDTLDLTPGEARIVFHAPISTQGLDASDLPRLVDQSREAILDRLSRA